ncbi:ADP compounds hydrolase NudE [Succinimonas sp.]|uniref:ADP compounds hydrolase NudE n=1 Tax=Succinimonas sp. TaxID=1936151 RepID=UPI00386E3E09
MEPDLILPEVLGVKEVARSRLFRIEEVDLRFSNGFRTRYERIPGGSGAVMVIPFDGKSFLFTREYCVGTESYELGFVKGKIDPGESPEEAALRELQEEIGFGARSIIPLRTITFAPGFMGLMMYIFLAQDLYPSKLSGDEPEEIRVYPFSVAEARDLVLNPSSPLRESRCIAGLIHALTIVNKNPLI